MAWNLSRSGLSLRLSLSLSSVSPKSGSLSTLHCSCCSSPASIVSNELKQQTVYFLVNTLSYRNCGKKKNNRCHFHRNHIYITTLIQGGRLIYLRIVAGVEILDYLGGARCEPFQHASHSGTLQSTNKPIQEYWCSVVGDALHHMVDNSPYNVSHCTHDRSMFKYLC